MQPGIMQQVKPVGPFLEKSHRFFILLKQGWDYK